MRKLFMILLALALLATPALAEGFASLEIDSATFAVLTDGTRLVRLSSGGEYQLVDEGSEITCLTALGNDVYYLKKTDAWQVCVARADGTLSVVCAFDGSVSASALSAWDGNLLLLVNDQLRILYPTSGVCLLYISAQMTEYAVSGEYVYYVAKGDTLLYSDLSGLSVTAGCLYRANLTTGNTSVVLKTGVGSLSAVNGVLYFRNYSDSVVADGNMVGRYYSFDLAGETLTQLADAQGVYPISGSVAIRTAQGITLSGSVIYTPAAGDEIASAGRSIAVYTPAQNRVTLVTPGGTSRVAYSGEELTLFEGATVPTAAPTLDPAYRESSGTWYDEYTGDAGYDVYDDTKTK